MVLHQSQLHKDDDVWAYQMLEECTYEIHFSHKDLDAYWETGSGLQLQEEVVVAFPPSA